MILRQSTSQVIKFGPFLDDTDFKTPETGLTINNTDVQLSKDGGNYVNKNSGGGTHDEDGEYELTLDATDTNTVGILKVKSLISGALPVWETYYVVEEAVYDAIYGSGAALAMGSVTGAVGSVTGNVGGNVVGEIQGSVQGDVEGNVDGSVASVTAAVTANLTQVDGVALASHTAGYVPSESLTDTGNYVELTITDAVFTPTTTQFRISESSPFAADDIPINRLLWFSDSGDTLYGAGTIILDWDNTNKQFTVRNLPQAPSNGDKVRIQFA